MIPQLRSTVVCDRSRTLRITSLKSGQHIRLKTDGDASTGPATCQAMWNGSHASRWRETFEISAKMFDRFAKKSPPLQSRRRRRRRKNRRSHSSVEVQLSLTSESGLARL